MANREIPFLLTQSKLLPKITLLILFMNAIMMIASVVNDIMVNCVVITYTVINVILVNVTMPNTNVICDKGAFVVNIIVVCMPLW